MGKVKNFLMGLAIFGGTTVLTGCVNKNENQTEDTLPPTEQKTDEGLMSFIDDIEKSGIPIVKKAIQEGEVDSLLQSIEDVIIIKPDGFKFRMYRNPEYMPNTPIKQPARVIKDTYNEFKELHTREKILEKDPQKVGVRDWRMYRYFERSNEPSKEIQENGDTVFNYTQINDVVEVVLDYETKQVEDKIQEAKDRIAAKDIAKYNIEPEVSDSESHNNSQRSITDLTVASVKEVEK